MTEAEVSGVDNAYRYSTKEWDEKAGLYYFGARYYSPRNRQVDAEISRKRLWMA